MDIKQVKMSQGRGSPKILPKNLSFSRPPNSGRMHPIYNSGRPHAELDGWPSSLSDLKEIGCKSVWLVYISPLFRPIEQLLDLKIVKIYPTPSHFRFENNPMAKKYYALPNVARLFQNAEPLSVRPRLCMTSSRHMGERAVRPRQASACTQAGRTASMRR